tara:strand:+ start:125 stop:346 length:222 start_codon:yes stop_codon:yes gene_type:complete
MKKNNGLSSDLLGSGYDRCSRGYVHVYGLLYEQTRERSGYCVEGIGGREQGPVGDFGEHGGDGNKTNQQVESK